MRRQRYRVGDGEDWLEHYKYPTVSDMQAEYGLRVTGQVDSPTREAMTARRCGCAYRRGAGQTVVKLSTNRPLVYFQDFIKTDFTQDTFVTEVLQGLNYWTPICDILFDRTSDLTKANIVVKTEVIDGPGETLAYAYFPSGARMNLPLVFGEEEAWDKTWGIDLKSTACHEGGHNMGIDHDPTAQGVMAAFYNPKILKPTSSWEINQAVTRYGAAKPVTPPVTPPVVPPPGNQRIELVISGQNIKVEGYKYV